jgi:hypothetical protein
VNHKVGDLLIRVRDKRPCLVAEVRESYKKEWGQLDANRRLYRLFDGASSNWLTDTQIRASYDVTTP